MKRASYTVLIDYALLLAKKFYNYTSKEPFPQADTEELKKLPPQIFAVTKHKLREYKQALQNFDLFSSKLTFEQKKMILLLFGSSLRQRNGVFLWQVAGFFHKLPARALKFISYFLDDNSLLIKNGVIVFENIDFSQMSMSVDKITNFYNSHRVFLSPLALTNLFGHITGTEMLGFPTLKLSFLCKSIDSFLSDISILMKYLFFIVNFYKVTYSPGIIGEESIYEKGEFAKSISALKRCVVQSPLKIELKNFIKTNKFSNLEFIFLLYLIHRVAINKEFIINNIEEPLNQLSFNPAQTRALLKCFSRESVFVREGIIEFNDMFNPFPFEEELDDLDDFEDIIDRDAIDDFAFDFTTIAISKEAIYRLIFTEDTPIDKIKSKVEKREESEDDERYNSRFDKNRVTNLFDIITPRVTLKNVILDEEIKRDLLGAVDMAKTIETMREWDVRPTLSSNSFSSIKILFYGPSGTGKTITAEALSGEVGAEMFKVDASNLVTSWVGESAKNVRRVFKEFFKYAKKANKPVFMFFNEADQLLSARGAVMQAADKEYNQMQNILLEELENFDGVFIATTNLVDLLDTAWNRRFNIKIKFDVPKYKTRLKLWQIHISPKLPLASDVNIAKLAEYELAGGNIANVVYNAARRAALRESANRVVSQKDFIDAIKHELNSIVGAKRNMVGFS
jgi:SpoVK/Ycf46/Vps4 family AAA+-type ATPase